MTTEDGFTLVETSVSLTIVGIVMASLTSFFITTTRITRQQNETEVATQVAAAAMSRVRGIKGSSLAYGRDATTSHQQWATPMAGVAPYLADSTETWDPNAAAGNGPSAPLPTTPQPATAGGITYQQSWYLGSCWQAATGVCDTTNGTGDVPQLRVVVAVTWPGADCPGDTCAYVRSTLVSPADDPVFVTGQ
jgi:prepilin-type N-terminal cleavage/methylation domain-containing protein